MTKLVSVITINLNNREGLKETIDSVLGQDFQDFEYMVIDGGSNDGSIEALKENNDKIDYWHSKPDSGIYNAMNQGLKIAKGEYIHFLNSGDLYFDSQVLKRFEKENDGADIIHGYIIDKEDITRKFGIVKHITKMYLCDLTIKHPGSFVRKDLFEKIGYFDESFLIAGDYDFFLRAIFKYQSSTSFIDFCVARFDIHGISNSMETILNSERIKARRNNIDIFTSILCTLIRPFKRIKYFIISKTKFA